MKKSFFLIAVLMLVLVCMPVFAQGAAEDAYPSKDIQFYVNADAGGGTDTICRKVTLMAEEALGSTFYLVNKPGVSDSVGPALCMDAAADGYTLCNVNYGSVVTAQFNKVTASYDVARLQPLCLVTEESDAVMISKNAPFKTFEEFIAYAKANPGKVRVGDQGIGSRVYLCVRKLEEFYGVEFNKISYSSSAPQREAMLNGEIDAAVTSLGDFTPLLLSGDAIGIVEFSSVRNGAYTTVPTCLECGMDSSFLSSSFIYFAAPKGIDSAKADKLIAAFKDVIEGQEFKDWTTSIGVTAHFLTGADLDKFISDVQTKDFAALNELKAQGII